VALIRFNGILFVSNTITHGCGDSGSRGKLFHKKRFAASTVFSIADLFHHRCSYPKFAFMLPNFRAGLAPFIDLQFMNGFYSNGYMISIQRSHHMVDICRKIVVLGQVFISSVRSILMIMLNM